jgi:hypothetical protein
MLQEEEFNAPWAEGRAIPLEHAITEALLGCGNGPE